MGYRRRIYAQVSGHEDCAAVDIMPSSATVPPPSPVDLYTESVLEASDEESGSDWEFDPQPIVWVLELFDYHNSPPNAGMLELTQFWVFTNPTEHQQQMLATADLTTFVFLDDTFFGGHETIEVWNIHQLSRLCIDKTIRVFIEKPQ